MYDLIIVGGGPAALAAALYARDKQLDAVVIDEQLGGKVGKRESGVRLDEGEQASSTRRYVMRDGRPVLELTPAIPAHRLVRVLVGDVLHTGSVLHERVTQVAHGATGFIVSTRAGSELAARSVLIASGATPRRLAVLNADQLVHAAIDYSIATYAQQTVGQHVAVVGSTPRALIGVVELLRIAAHVTLIASEDAFLHTPLGEALAQHPRVEILAPAEVVAVHGSLALEALEALVDGDARRIVCERAFVDLGLRPNSEIVRELAELDEHGYITVDQHNMTATPGLFAAGDVTSAGDEQVLAAIGDGARAAKRAYLHLITKSFVGGLAQA